MQCRRNVDSQVRHVRHAENTLSPSPLHRTQLPCTSNACHHSACTARFFFFFTAAASVPSAGVGASAAPKSTAGTLRFFFLGGSPDAATPFAPSGPQRWHSGCHVPNWVDNAAGAANAHVELAMPQMWVQCGPASHTL